MEDCEDDEEEVVVDKSRKRGFQLMNDLETYMQFQEIDPAILRQMKDVFNKVQDTMHRDYVAKLK